MKLFPYAHATHPDWRMCLSMVVAQLRAQLRQPDHAGKPTLGFVYLCEPHAAHVDALVRALQEAFPGLHWTGSVAVGVASNGVEYFDEPGLVVMLADLAPASFRAYSGVRPLNAASGFDAHTALVHADPGTPEVSELIAELGSRTATGYLFGGLSSGRAGTVQISDGALRGGLSGVAFDDTVVLVSRVTQGCQPISPTREITETDQNVIVALDGRPALDVLFEDLGIDERQPRKALNAMRVLLVGLTDAASQHLPRPGQFGSDTRVRHLIGVDPQRRGIAIADRPEAGTQLAFCTRDTQAARRDLVRICTEIREELEPEELTLETATALAGGRSDSAPHPARGIAGAIYVSCAGRGGPHFGAPSAEMQIIRHALGDVPMAGFFAGGEIARHHLYGYTGVLTVFVKR